MKAGNSILVKMNQIGTLTETVFTLDMAKNAGFKTIVSARSGETEDATLSDLAVGLNGGQIKIGSVAGSSRLAKYNQLLRINEQLNGKYMGSSVFDFNNISITKTVNTPTQDITRLCELFLIKLVAPVYSYIARNTD